MKISVKTFFIITIISLFSIYLLQFLQISQPSFSNNLIFSIKYEYFGMDAEEIEKTITIPLEKKLLELDNIIEIKSSCQVNQSTTTIVFDSCAILDTTYLSIRKITEQLSNSLPKDVQPCKILMSESSGSNLICVSFDCTKNELRKYQSLFESIDGVSEIQLLGHENKDIVLQFSNDKLIHSGVLPSQIINAVQANNSLNEEIRLITNNSVSRLYFQNQLGSIEDFANIFINTKESIIPLTELCTVSYKSSIPHEICLINNKETLLLYVNASSDSNWISISKKIQNVIKSQDLSELNPVIIYDKGKEQLQKLTESIIFYILSLFIISLVFFLYSKSNSITFYFIVINILSVLWTLGTLGLCKICITLEGIIGFTLSSFFLNYTSFITFNEINNSNNPSFFNKILFLPFICISIILFTFLFIKLKLSRIFPVILILFLMNIYNYCLCYLIYSLSTRKHSNSKILNHLFKTIFTKFKSNIFIIFSSILFVISVVLVFFIKIKSSFNSTDNIISMYMDYNPERSIQSIQNELSYFLENMQSIKGIEFVSTEISTGRCHIEIISDSNTVKVLNKKMHEYSTRFPNTNVYIPEQTSGNNHIQIIITGNDILKCQEIAKSFSFSLNNPRFINQIVFNFKDNQKQYIYLPDSQLLANANYSVKHLALYLRNLIYGPVISKLKNKDSETDIKIQSTPDSYISTVINMLQLQMNEEVKSISNSGTIMISSKPSKINRLNSKQCAYLTLEVKHNTRKTKKYIQQKISDYYLDEGYSISIYNPKFETNYSQLLYIIFVLSIGITCIIIQIVYENVLYTLLIELCTIPLLIPELIILLSGIEISLLSFLVMILFVIMNIVLVICLIENAKKEYE